MSSGLNNIFSQVQSSGEAIAVWRQPGKALLFISCKELIETTIQEPLQKGFLLAPFDTENERTWFFKGTPQNTFFDQESDKAEFYKSVNNQESTTKEQYMELAKKAIEAIKAGEYEKIVAARKQVIPNNNGDLLAFFQKLCSTYPDAYCYLISAPQTGTWIGASPELLLRFDENSVKTMALAGTKTSQANEWQKKEMQEQQFVTDYIVDQLELQGLEVKINEKKDIRSGNLFHLVNVIEGFGKNIGSQIPAILHALHPTPAVAGLPKKAAIDFILKNEPLERKYYAGFLGYSNGVSGDFYVNLRCMQWNKNHNVLYAGAGLTINSDPEKEWEETNNKLRVLGDLF